MKYFNSIASTLYGELVETLLTQAYPVKGLSVFTRTIKGRPYWYLQTTVGDRKSSHYLGPDTPQIQERVDRLKDTLEQVRESARSARELVSALLSFGYAPHSGRELRVIQSLAQAGVFQAGGVLVGSHAFRLIGHQLCVQWKDSLQTQDIDIAGDASMQVAVPNIDVDLMKTLDSVEKGFLPVPMLDRKQPSTSFSLRGGQLRIDLLTPMMGKPDTTPVKLRAINSYAYPVRFLDYLIEDIGPAAVVGGEGALVNVPHPARFALHKLVVAIRRPVSEEGKRLKDIRQAEQVLLVLLDNRPGDIDVALDAAERMPAKFMTQMREGTAKLPDSIRRRLPKRCVG